MSGKTKVLAVARKLFWKKGYKSTSMNDIAVAYGCKPGNLYNFFDSKEAILFEVLWEEMEQIIDPIKHLEHDENANPIEQLRLIISSHVQLTLSHRRTAKSLFDVALDSLSPSKRKQIIGLRDTYDRILRKVITRGIRAKCFSETDPSLAGILIASMIVRTRVWFHPKKGLSLDEIADFIFRFTLNGLGRGQSPGQRGFWGKNPPRESIT